MDRPTKFKVGDNVSGKLGQTTVFGRIIVYPTHMISVTSEGFPIPYKVDFTYEYGAPTNHFNSKGDLYAINYGPEYRTYLVYNEKGGLITMNENVMKNINDKVKIGKRKKKESRRTKKSKTR